MGLLQTVPAKVREAQDMMERMRPQIADLLPKHARPERMIRIFRAMLTRRPKLAQCSTMSLMSAVVECSVLGLEPETALGHAWILPYKNEAQLIIGYRGYIEMAYRSNRVRAVCAETVHEKDHFERRLGTEWTIVHRPFDGGDRGPLTGVYAVAHLDNGGKPFVYLSKSEVDGYRSKSPAARSGSSPWATDYAAMAKKTAVRRLATYIPQSAEIAQAVQLEDQLEVHGRQEFMLAAEVDAATAEADDNGAEPLRNRIGVAKATQGELIDDDARTEKAEWAAQA